MTGYIHIDGTFMLQYILSTFFLIVEDNVCAEAANKVAFLVAAGGRDHFQSVTFGQLNNKTTNGAASDVAV